MKPTKLIPFLLLTGLFLSVPSSGFGYDKQVYDEINSSLSCQCGCGLLVSVCKMEGCMSGTVRQQVGQLLDQDKSPKEVKQALIGVYGKQILAAPPKSGFDLTAYVLPFLFLLIGGSVVYSIALKWRKRASEPDETVDGSENENGPATGTSSIRHRNQIEKELKDLKL
ncbi:MAG TPA: cytochrome c-type biogenesis protein CcmH [bacterium]|nr:cytochrome c-type biogenesis protein CcmH [bacterium]